jgi:hypothetical protein
MSKKAQKIVRTPRRKIAALLGVLALVAICLTVVSTSGAATGPTNTVAPSVTGTAQQGQSLTTSTGTWTSSNPPIQYGFNWQRCNPDASACANIAGATSASYTPGIADVGSTLRSVVTGTDSAGSQDQASAITAVVTAAANTSPVNTVPATISGTTSVGSTLTVANGTFTGAQPITYTYAWQLCDTTGASCAPITGASAQTYLVASTALGKTLRAVVTATNASGSATSTTVPTALIAAGTPTTAIKLSNGKTSIDASDVKGTTARLILSTFKVQQTQPLHSRAPFKVTFTVTDTRGYLVRNALVYVIGLPYNRILTAPEQHTSQDGTVTFTLTPTKLQPLKTGARLVIFGRARIDGDQLLAGASTRRLVEVVFGAA